jgi:hypothetical protein
VSLIQPQRRAQSVFIILGACLILATLACQLQLGGPRPPSPPAGLPSEASTPLEQAWASAVEAAGRTGEITLTVDESQLNGLVQQKLDADANSIILQPQVFLRQGQIQLYGVSTQGLVRARVHVSIKPVVNSDGQLEFDIPSAEFGPFPAPQALKEAVSRSINELFTGAVGPLAVGFRVTSVIITDGQMAIVATIR